MSYIFYINFCLSSLVIFCCWRGYFCITIYGSHWSDNNVSPIFQRHFVTGGLVVMMDAAHHLIFLTTFPKINIFLLKIRLRKLVGYLKIYLDFMLTQGCLFLTLDLGLGWRPWLGKTSEQTGWETFQGSNLLRRRDCLIDQ